MPALSLNEPSELIQVAHDHHVVYEAWPVRVPQSGELRAIGYDVILIGTHEHPLKVIAPGCQRCVQVWDQLRRIAQAVLPEASGSTVEIRPFDSSLHFDKHRSMRPDVELLIEIRHETNHTAPTPPSEDDCLAVLVGNLKELGIGQ